MKTLVYPPPSGIGHTAYVGVIARPLSAVEANAIGVTLNEQQIRVAVSVAGGVIHLWPWVQLTTADEVRTLRAFVGVTDARLVMHKALAPC